MGQSQRTKHLQPIPDQETGNSRCRQVKNPKVREAGSGLSTENGRKESLLCTFFCQALCQGNGSHWRAVGRFDDGQGPQPIREPIRIRIRTGNLHRHAVVP